MSGRVFQEEYNPKNPREVEGNISFYSQRVYPDDLSVMIDCLAELFQEDRDRVKPIRLAERMSVRLKRTISFHYASHLFILCGFVTRRSIIRSDNNSYYVIPDDDLLARCRTQHCKVGTVK